MNYFRGEIYKDVVNILGELIWNLYGLGMDFAGLIKMHENLYYNYDFFFTNMESIKK